MNSEFILRPIGVIHTPFPSAADTPIQPSRAGDARGEVLVDMAYREGLRDLEGFERVWLVYWFHQSGPPALLVTPFLDTQRHGVFATRAPARPSPIGISAVRLLAVRGGVLDVSGVDMLDGTPLLDVKPYVPEFDSYPEARAGWFDESRSQRTLGDARFIKPTPPRSES
ncbi:MAG: tRNA (N6-threonylcarbamoyladenosine(37)-N6)-methyltransferase TrmO [Bryobacterales bacterium]|nr:tRNA (N6-threonylcarbamoyladenosine(37)-N6)-methyltransferase TrmO [Bryobacterales bacterium]